MSCDPYSNLKAKHCYYPHFTGEEPRGREDRSNLPRDILLTRGDLSSTVRTLNHQDMVLPSRNAWHPVPASCCVPAGPPREAGTPRHLLLGGRGFPWIAGRLQAMAWGLVSPT